MTPDDKIASLEQMVAYQAREIERLQNTIESMRFESRFASSMPKDNFKPVAKPMTTNGTIKRFVLRS